MDSDWRNACSRYPETLDYFFGCVEVGFAGGKGGGDGVGRLEGVGGGGGGGGGKRRARRDSGVGEKGGRKERRG